MAKILMTRSLSIWLALFSRNPAQETLEEKLQKGKGISASLSAELKPLCPSEAKLSVQAAVRDQGDMEGSGAN